MAEPNIRKNVVLRERVVEVWLDGEPHQISEHCKGVF